MAKINFTTEHFEKLCRLALNMLMSNDVVFTKLGVALNVSELIHTTTINTLNDIRLHISKTIEKLEGTNNYYCALNSEELKLPLYFRNRLDSDKMEVLNLNGTKKVKDILINEKIDISLRKNYPVLCDSDGNILWLPGIKKSKYDKSKAGKYDIIIKCIKKED